MAAFVSPPSDLQAHGAQMLPDGRCGLRIHGWEIESVKRPILNSESLILWEERLGEKHMPEMVFGESMLSLRHTESGVVLRFNAFDALKGWKDERLPAVQVPAAAKWTLRSKPSKQVILDYDYTFTTPYCGSETVERYVEKTNLVSRSSNLNWEECDEKIDLSAPALSSVELILFYDEVILYEDELADSGVSLLTVKVRVMPSCWYLLLRFWLRVDGALMRLRDTRIYCPFGPDNKSKSVILREISWREATFSSLCVRGNTIDSEAYGDPSLIAEKLPIVMQKNQKLLIPC